MNATPKGRANFIRVDDPVDQAAWHEFVEIYRPIILRLARKQGLQESEADSIAQQLLVAIAKTLGQQENDPKRAKFRTLLNRVSNPTGPNGPPHKNPNRASTDH